MNKRIYQFCSSVLLLAALSALGACYTSDGDMQLGSESHFLKGCSSDAECAHGSMRPSFW